METEISLSESLYEQAQAVAREMNITFDQLFLLALEDFTQRRQNQQLFESANEAYKDGLTEEEQDFLRQKREAQRDVVEAQW
jgi:hypothetical protein